MDNKESSKKSKNKVVVADKKSKGKVVKKKSKSKDKKKGGSSFLKRFYPDSNETIESILSEKDRVWLEFTRLDDIANAKEIYADEFEEGSFRKNEAIKARNVANAQNKKYIDLNEKLKNLQEKKKELEKQAQTE